MPNIDNIFNDDPEDDPEDDPIQKDKSIVTANLLTPSQKQTIKVLSTLFDQANFYICGGAARQLYLNKDFGSTDIDIFCKNKGDFVKLTKLLASNKIVDDASTYAISYLYKGLKLQIVKNNYNMSLCDVFQDFDFTVCCFAFDRNYIYYSESAIRDLDTKIIRLNTYYFRVYSLFKYMNKGFILSDELKDHLD
jgi:hypothetical protein